MYGLSYFVTVQRRCMGEIYISRDQQIALAEIDSSALDKLIEQAIDEERLGDLHRLPLSNRGSCVATKLRYFKEALAKHCEAKAPRKRPRHGCTTRWISFARALSMPSSWRSGCSVPKYGISLADSPHSKTARLARWSKLSDRSIPMFASIFEPSLVPTRASHLCWPEPRP